MPSSNVPQPESYEQLLGDALSSYAAAVGISDFNVGSAVTSFFEVCALMTARSSGDIFQILTDYSVIRATGSALQLLATENGITPITATPATGYVTITDLSFNVISTQVYAGTPSPNIGSTTINVGNASLFPSTGSVYIGRGTPNVEGPISYGGVSIALIGSTMTSSNVITGIPSTANLLVGYPIFSPNNAGLIPAGAVITSIDSATQIHISLPATGMVVGASLTYQTPPVQTGNFWTITLNAATVKYHNVGETVVLAQGGNRSIPVNTIVVAPAIGGNPNIQYAVTTSAIILDGQTTVSNVPVTAQLAGSSGNVPAGTINSFAANPPGLPNASVTNPLSFSTGQDNETDNSLRTRIMAKLSSIGLGTAYAVESGVIGAQASDEPGATLVSDDLLITSYGSILYIDDGTGYEAKFAGVGLESIVSSAIGGEQYFQLVTGGRQAPVAKAFLISTLGAPFALTGGDSLAVVVGGTTYQHNFATSDFRTPNSATAYEVAASINADTALGFSATTSGGGTYVVISGKAEGHDNIQTTTPITEGRNAAVQLGFPSSQYQTLRLYLNNIPLTEDGNTATVSTTDQALWSASITNGDTLVLSVDDTAAITYTFLDSDFIATGLYTSVSSINSLASWVEVFNNKLTGITAQIVGSQIAITSNLLASNRASVVIEPSSTLVTKGMFATSVGLSSQGAASDYTLDRNTAQFQLVTPLKAGDQLSAGSTETQARLESTEISGGSITFTGPGYMWLLIDNPGTIIQTGIFPNTLLGVSKPSTDVIRYSTDVANAFNNVQPGDYLIVWSTDLVSANRLEGHVHAVTNTTLDVVVTPAEYAAAVPTSGVTFTQGFVVLRSSRVPQKFEVTGLPQPSFPATLTLDQIAAAMQAQTNSLNFSVQLEEFLIMATNSNDPTKGELLVVTADSQGQLLGFPAGSTDTTTDSLIAFYDSQEYDAQLPLFVHSTISTGTVAYPPDTYIQSFASSTDLTGRNPNELISFLEPYGIPDALTTTGNIVALSNQLTSLASVSGISFGQFIVGNGIPVDTTVLSISGTTVTMSNNATTNTTGVTVTFNTLAPDDQAYGEYIQESYPPPTTTVNISYPDLSSNSDLFVSRDIRRLRGTDGPVPDRYFIANPLDFGPTDTMVIVLDNNPSLETFDVPLYRPATTNTTLANNATTFNAYDTAAGPTASFATDFGSTFDFSNFKVLMKAKRVLLGGTLGNQTSLLYRSAEWGTSGTYVNVGYVYPSAPNLPIGSVVTVNDITTILISLQSGAAISSAINASTEWNITVTENTPSAGIEQVTYTWNGTGTAPALTLSGGEYVNITTGTEFDVANTGIFRVSTATGFTPTATSFSVQMANGTGVAQTNAATNINGAITFYASNATTAAAIAAYVNSSLSQYLTATIVNDGGTTGSGVVVYSTAENSSFAYSTVQLMDGINWIAYNNLTGSPQFVLKKSLAYPSDTGYAFNNGEPLILSPTTMDQVNRFISTLAVSGFTTEGSVSVVDRGTTLELATQTLGSAGAVQILGGLGNEYETPVLGSATRVNNSLMNITVNSVAGQGINSDQWFRLQATSAQAKETLVSSNTSVTIIPNSPIVGQSTIQLLNQELNQRYFGKPRNNVRVQGDTFRIEKQGSLACLSWNPNSGSSPMFETNVNFNASGGGTLNVAPVTGLPDELQYIILTGAANFTELSINDLVTISGMPNPVNNGTFLVTGVSSNGTILQVLNPNGEAEYSSGTFTFTGPTTSGDQFVIGATTLVAGTNFAIGGTAGQTAANFSAAAGTVPGVTSSVSGDVVTITATSPSASIAISTNSSEATASGASLTGAPYTGSTFSATIGVTEGDTVIIGAPFNVLNQGQFRVIREYNNSIWFENSNMVQEEVTLPYNPVAITFDNTTSFNVNASGNSFYLSWNYGVGTQPQLGFAQVGDIITLSGSEWSAGNRGSFMITNSGTALQQITSFNMPSGLQFASSGPGQYFRLYNAGNISPSPYYVWFNVTGGSNTDPAPGGTGLEVTITSSFTAQQVAAAAAAVILAANSGADFTTSSANGVLTVTTTGFDTTMSAVNGTMPSPFAITIVQTGQTTFLEAINPSAVSQSTVLVTTPSTDLLLNRPQMVFYEYEATVPGDILNLTSSNFLTANVGTWTIFKVLNESEAIVTGTMTAVSNVSLNNIISSFFIAEGVPYYGYKHVLFTATQPGAPTDTLVTFTTNAQVDKIDQAGGVQLTALNKLNYNTVIKLGIDSYRYNTGLIAEANRIIYGDPRDNLTYPGIGAAGTDIFVTPPLILRIQIDLDIRLNTGVPFAQTAQQVQDSVSSLINANPLGQSISISSIISAVQAIPGIISVAVSFPAFSPTNDLITLVTGQKAYIVDPTTDITVGLIGS
jgi:hypothetical protein